MFGFEPFLKQGEAVFRGHGPRFPGRRRRGNLGGRENGLPVLGSKNLRFLFPGEGPGDGASDRDAGKYDGGTYIQRLVLGAPTFHDLIRLPSPKLVDGHPFFTRLPFFEVSQRFIGAGHAVIFLFHSARQRHIRIAEVTGVSCARPAKEDPEHNNQNDPHARPFPLRGPESIHNPAFDKYGHKNVERRKNNPPPSRAAEC